MAASDPVQAIAMAQAAMRRRRAAAWCAATAAALALAALALGAGDAALALGDRPRQVGGWLWLAAAPAALAALLLRWRGLAPQGDAAVRCVERALGDGERTLAQALELRGRDGELAQAAAAALAGRLPLHDLPGRLPPSRAPRWLLLLALALAIAALAWVLAPRLSATVWRRWTDPLGDHPPWSPTSLVWAASPERVRARHDARIEVAAEGRPCEAPALLVQGGGSLHRIAMFPVGPGRWAAEIARVERPLTIWAEGGGTRTQRRAIAIDPVPELESLDLRLEQPAYARLDAAERRLRSGEQSQLDMLPGAALSLRPAANRPLAAIHLARDEGGWTRLALRDGSVALPAEPGLWRLRLEAGDGALGEVESPLRLALRSDQPPLCDVAEPARDAYATPDTSVPFRIVASDDLGLASADRLREVNGLPVPTAPATPSGRSWVWAGVLDLPRLGADPGDVITLGAVVRDSDPAIGAGGRPGKPSPVASRSVQVIAWDEYNRLLLQRLDVSAGEAKYAPLASELAELARLSDELRKARLEPDELDKRLAELRARASALAAKVEAMKRPQPLFRFEPQLQQALAEAARDLAEGKEPRWDAESLRKDLQELTRRARGMDLARRLGQLADAEQNTVERILPLAGHRRPTDGDLLRLSELGQQEELLAKELDTWLELADRWVEQEKENLPRESGKMKELAQALDDSGAIELKNRSAAAARAGDGAEAHRLAGEARDRLLALLDEAGLLSGELAGGAQGGMGWSDQLGGDLGGLMGCAGLFGLGGRGSAGLGMWLGYGGDDLGGSLPSLNADLYGPENLGASGAERQLDGGDPIAAMASSGNAVGLGAAVRQRGTARGTAASRSTLGEPERRLVEDYFKRLEGSR